MRKLVEFAELPLSKRGEIAVAELARVLVVLGEVFEHV